MFLKCAALRGVYLGGALPVTLGYAILNFWHIGLGLKSLRLSSWF